MSKYETKEQRRKLSLNYWAKNRQYVIEAKQNPCVDCGVQYPHYVMQFDHRPDEIKKFGLGQMGTRGLKLIQAEIAKCDLVCANCHAERTYQRMLDKGYNMIVPQDRSSEAEQLAFNQKCEIS